MEIQQSTVQSDLAAYLPDLRQHVMRAVDDYKERYESSLRVVHSKRSVASLIHDHIISNMAKFAEANPGVEIRSSKNLWILTFPQGYIVRFKKVGSSKLPSGWKTGQVKGFRNQRGIDGLPPAICLDLGYQLNSTGDLHAVYLICPAGVWSNMWDSVLTEDGARPVVVSLFGEPTEPQGATLQPKKKDTGRETQSGDGDIGA